MYSKDRFSTTIPLTNHNFQKILNFYLFECPVEGTSIRADTFKERGWEGKDFSTLKKQMLASATRQLRDHYFPCKKEELEQKFLDTEALYKEEFCVFLKHDETRVMDSLYGAIRNALAHGSFTRKKHKNEVYYFFANYNGYLKAKIQLTESTLLSWIALIKNHPKK